MGWTQVDTGAASTYGSTVTLTVDVAVNAGDLIVVGAGGSAAAIYPNAFADEDANEYTVRTLLTQSTTASLRTAYAIAAGNNAALTITVTFEAGTTRRNLRVVVFRPDSGDTVSLDDAATKAAYEASPWETGTFDTSGDDEAVVAFVRSAGTITFSNHELPSGTAATVIETDEATMTAFYKLLTETVSSAIAEVDTSGSDNYCMEVLAFKAAPAGSVVPILVQTMRRRR